MQDYTGCVQFEYCMFCAIVCMNGRFVFVLSVRTLPGPAPVTVNAYIMCVYPSRNASLQRNMYTTAQMIVDDLICVCDPRKWASISVSSQRRASEVR